MADRGRPRRNISPVLPNRKTAPWFVTSVSLRKPMFKYMLVEQDLTWLLIGWWLSCHPVRGYVLDFFTQKYFNIALRFSTFHVLFQWSLCVVGCTLQLIKPLSTTTTSRWLCSTVKYNTTLQRSNCKFRTSATHHMKGENHLILRHFGRYRYFIVKNLPCTLRRQSRCLLTPLVIKRDYHGFRM